MKAPPPKRAPVRVLALFYAQNSETHPSTQLTGCTLRPGADDFKPGSHLEVGEIVKRRICPSGRLEGATVTSRLEPHTGRAALTHDTGWISQLQADGMSAYPAPLIGSRHISRADMGGDL